ncbi:MAG: Periplasmic copper-binding protein (NosD) [Candidatus Argoarchaeum ethanivorans]|uniref:Periplasmic copper-binding protein (NosD) n=1 Tax=Candidatus Argoarchaeum ethanivorans TaxID=2608793 RepID=A0A811T4W9_9EURY|nr:MAG: Periplasmic copper-binding protein (NosD) [Candidatus Argoarchaeum ethanivorans]
MDYSNNTLTNNTASNNTYGIYLRSSCNYNTLTNNTANSNNYYGIYLSHSSNNTLTNNTANSNNYYGIYLYYSSNNLLYHNNLINNTNHNAYDISTNQWNTSTVGNYYSDYTGSDNNSDGIGDTSYQIPGGSSIDYFPLMHPWGKPPLKGDLDGDSQITSTDAAIVLEIAVGSSPCNSQILAIADVSGDGRVSSLDALMILQMAA